MFEQSDQRFLQSLEKPAEFEKLLKQLRLGRKIMTIYTVTSYVAFLVMLAVNEHFGMEMRPEVHYLFSLMSMMLFSFPLVFLINVCHTNSQIKSLLIYQKLSGQGATATSAPK